MAADQIRDAVDILQAILRSETADELTTKQKNELQTKAVQLDKLAEVLEDE